MAVVARLYVKPVRNLSEHLGTLETQAIHTPKATTTSGDSIRYASSFLEPLGNDRYGSDELEAHAPSKAYALSQEEMPDLRRKAGTDEG